MSFPFRMQKIFAVPAPKVRTRESLPAPPEGMDWVQNPNTKEWRLVKATEPPEGKVETRAQLQASGQTTAAPAGAATQKPDAAEPMEISITTTVPPEPTPAAATKTPIKSPGVAVAVAVTPQPSPKKEHVTVIPATTTTSTAPTPPIPELLLEETEEEPACTGTTTTPNLRLLPPTHPGTTTSGGGGGGMLTTPPQFVIDHLPNFARDFSSSSSQREEDWELLSDRYSASGNNSTSHHLSLCSGLLSASNRSSSGGNNNNNNNNNNAVFVPRAGSVRSIDEATEHNNNSSHNNNNNNNNNNNGEDDLSIPFKIQRTASSSTIDSSDGALGPSGKGVLGVDYVEHVILPSSDTLQGICLAYKISSTRLKQANHFSGNSLLLAPKKLVIPISKKALRSGFIRIQDTDAKEYKLHAFLAEFPDLGMTEAKAYLELADWVLEDAVRSCKDDGEWEEADTTSFKSGEIRIRMNQKGMTTKGAGIKTEEIFFHQEKQPPKIHRNEDIPAIATKTVKAEDVYKAASQHNNFGVELQTLSPRSEG